MIRAVSQFLRQYQVTHWPNFILALMVFAFGTMLVAVTVLVQQKAIALRKLPTASAIVVAAEVVEIDPIRNIHPAYQHHITYLYPTSSGTMMNACSSYGAYPYRWRSRKTAADLLPVRGIEKAIHYVPDDPSRCYDHIVVNTPNEQVALLVFVIFTSFGGGGLMLRASTKRREASPD